MDFNPADENQENAGLRLLEDGEYELEVREAEERVSSKGNPMIVLELVPVGHARPRIYEYLVATPDAMFKIRQFTEAAGLERQFASGRLTETDCRGRRVRARVKTEEQDGYAPKNRVEEFIPGAVQAAPAAVRPAAASPHAHPDHDPTMDGIPF